MSRATKIIDRILFMFFLLMSIISPLIDAQSCLPRQYYPKSLVDLKSWYTIEFGDYLVEEKPNFFVGLVWLELICLWPLSILSLFAFIFRKSWFNTTCLIYGVSITTSMVAILSEMVGLGRASEKLLMVYYPFLGLGVLALLRGLLPASCKTTISFREKRASNQWRTYVELRDVMRPP